MKREPNINIDKLRESQLIKDDYYNNSELIKEEVERKRKKREEAKQAIIKKINEGANQEIEKKQPETKIKKNETPQSFFRRTEVKTEKETEEELPKNIRVIKNDKVDNSKEVIRQAQEKLSYTLQMDAVSHDQISMYKKRKKRMQGIDLNDKFRKFNPKITKIYIALVIILLILIVIAVIILQYI